MSHAAYHGLADHSNFFFNYWCFFLLQLIFSMGVLIRLLCVVVAAALFGSAVLYQNQLWNRGTVKPRYPFSKLLSSLNISTSLFSDNLSNTNRKSSYKLHESPGDNSTQKVIKKEKEKCIPTQYQKTTLHTYKSALHYYGSYGIVLYILW